MINIEMQILSCHICNKYLQKSFSWRYEMKGNCLTVSVRRRKTVLMDGTELSKEMMWGGENLKRATEAGDFIESLVKEMKVLGNEINFNQPISSPSKIKISHSSSLCRDGLIIFRSSNKFKISAALL